MLQEKLNKNFQKAIDKKLKITTKCVKRQEKKLINQIEDLVTNSLCDPIYKNALVNPKTSKTNIDYCCLNDSVMENGILDSAYVLLTTIVT